VRCELPGYAACRGMQVHPACLRCCGAECGGLRMSGKWMEAPGDTHHVRPNAVRVVTHALGHEQVVCGTMGLPTATVQMLGPDGITHVATGLGTGPVDAAYKAIDLLIRVPARPPSPS